MHSNTKFNITAKNRVKKVEVNSHPQLLWISILLAVKYWWIVKSIKSAARNKIGGQPLVNWQQTEVKENKVDITMFTPQGLNQQ